MTCTGPSLKTAGAMVCLLALFVTGAVFTADGCNRRHATQAQDAASIHQGAADAHQVQAQASDHLAADLQAKLATSQADVDRLRQELGRLRSLANTRPQDDQPTQATAPSAGDPAPLIAKQDELIQAQDQQIQVLKAENVALTKARDEWKATALERERQALAQAAATEAWKKAVTTSRWSGRIEGFAAGLLVGYIGGKR